MTNCRKRNEMWAIGQKKLEQARDNAYKTNTNLAALLVLVDGANREEGRVKVLVEDGAIGSHD